MAKKEKDTKLRPDANEIARRVLREATGQAPKTPPPEARSEDEKNPEAVKRGSVGGTKGGPARAEKLTPKELKQGAREAARARWSSTQVEDGSV